MATYPAIEPDDRQFSLGAFPVSAASSFNNDQTRFSYGEEETDHDLSFSYVRRSNAELTQIRDHHEAQDGGHKSFQFPAIIWQGHTTSSDVVPINGRWRYVGPPDETHQDGGLHDFTVQFQYVGLSSTS
jgi:hypothetical protein